MSVEFIRSGRGASFIIELDSIIQARLLDKIADGVKEAARLYVEANADKITEALNSEELIQQITLKIAETVAERLKAPAEKRAGG